MEKNTWLISPKDIGVLDICNHDPHLHKLINYIGPIEIQLRTNYFDSLVHSIIGQLISAKAAKTIYTRLQNLVEHDITPERILQQKDKIKSIGLTNRKTEYIHLLAEKFMTNELNFDHIEHMSNEDVVNMLIQMKGIGTWTSQIFLIYSLGKKDVLPIDDVGLHRAARWLYAPEGEGNGKTILIEQSAKWGENLTIPCIYLWEVVNQDILLKYEDIHELVAMHNYIDQGGINR